MSIFVDTHKQRAVGIYLQAFLTICNHFGFDFGWKWFFRLQDETWTTNVNASCCLELAFFKVALLLWPLPRLFYHFRCTKLAVLLCLWRHKKDGQRKRNKRNQREISRQTSCSSSHSHPQSWSSIHSPSFPSTLLTLLLPCLQSMRKTWIEIERTQLSSLGLGYSIRPREYNFSLLFLGQNSRPTRNTRQEIWK